MSASERHYVARSAETGAVTGTVVRTGGPIGPHSARAVGGRFVVAEGWRALRFTTAVPGVALVQIVHASAALAALGPVEVYVNQPASSTAPDATLDFSGATAFLSVAAGQPLTVRTRLQTPPPPGLPRETTLTTGPLGEGRHVVSLAGIPTEWLSLFAFNPMGLDRTIAAVAAPFSFFRTGVARQPDGTAAVVVTHAVTDAPAIDVVVAETGQILADDLPYGQSTAASLLPVGTHRVEIRRAGDGALLEAVRFVLDGTEETVAFTATGFLDPAANQGGPALSLTATDETGATDTGVVVTSADAEPGAALSLVVASPVRGAATVRFTLGEGGPARLVVVDVLGREVAVLVDGAAAAGAHTRPLDARGLAPGSYWLRLTTPSTAAVRALTVVR